MKFRYFLIYAGFQSTQQVSLFTGTTCLQNAKIVNLYNLFVFENFQDYSTPWCSEIGSLTSLNACNSAASSDVREPISLHLAVQVWPHTCWSVFSAACLDWFSSPSARLCKKNFQSRSSTVSRSISSPCQQSWIHGNETWPTSWVRGWVPSPMSRPKVDTSAREMRLSVTMEIQLLRSSFVLVPACPRMAAKWEKSTTSIDATFSTGPNFRWCRCVHRMPSLACPAHNSKVKPSNAGMSTSVSRSTPVWWSVSNTRSSPCLVMKTFACKSPHTLVFSPSTTFQKWLGSSACPGSMFTACSCSSFTLSSSFVEKWWSSSKAENRRGPGCWLWSVMLAIAIASCWPVLAIDWGRSETRLGAHRPERVPTFTWRSSFSFLVLPEAALKVPKEVRVDPFTSTSSVRQDCWSIRLSHLLSASRSANCSRASIPSLANPSQHTPALQWLGSQTSQLLSPDAMEVESPVKEVDAPPLDIRHLLVSSLQGAASRLEDDDDQASAKVIAERVRSRIEWLRLALLGSIHHGNFIEVLAKRMLPLLEEQDSFAHNACGWVQREALATSGLQAGGTFQRALWIKLRASVEPILTEVLSAIDCCSNAKHFVSEEAWIHHLAVAILSDSDIVPLRFDNEILRAKLSHRAPVRNVGARDHFFECMFPFPGWLQSRLTPWWQPQEVSPKSPGGHCWSVCVVLSTSRLWEG